MGITDPDIHRHVEEHGDALRFAAKLGRLADQGRLEGVEINVVDDVVVLSPVSLEHSETCDELRLNGVGLTAPVDDAEVFVNAVAMGEVEVPGMVKQLRLWVA